MDKLRWFTGLRSKLFLSFVAVSIIPLIFITLAISSLIEADYISNRKDELRRKAGYLADSVKRGGYLSDVSKADYFTAEMTRLAANESFRVLILDSRSIVLYDKNGTETGVTFYASEVITAFSKRSSVAELQADGVTMFTAVPITNEQSDPEGMVLLVSSTADIFELLDTISNLLLLLSLGTTMVILVAVFMLSKFIISPLKRVLKVVNLMGDGHLNQRIELNGKDEFSLLAEAFNNMNDRLEQVDKTRGEFVSNVSHELKTPLSSIKVLSESILIQDDVPIEMYREFLQDINSEVDRMTFIVNDLLNLVKLDQRDKPLNIKLTDVNKMAEDILKRLYPLAEAKHIEVLYEDVRKVIISGDEMKLSLAISNLVENGIKYTQEGGTVKVIVDADHQNAFITVSDTGIGMAEEEQSKIFTRFYRIDKTRDRDTGGTGLGLAITHSTVLLHGGAIRLTSKEGEGSTFVVRLPIHANQPNA